MAIIKAEGIIIRSQNYLETSKIITCYCRNHGKVSLLARGARRARSKLGGGLDLLQHIGILYYQKESRSLQTLSQVDITHSFLSFQSDLKRFSLASAAAEIVDKLELIETPNPRLFIILLQSLQSLERAASPDLIFHQFIWRWLECSGFKPKLRRCMNCGSEPAKGTSVRFLISQGGYFCHECEYPAQDFVEISCNCIRLVLHLRDNHPGSLLELKIPNRLLEELRKFTWDFLCYHVDTLRGIKSLAFLNKIKQEQP